MVRTEHPYQTSRSSRNPAGRPFYVVAPLKFWTLTLLTGGAWEIAWHYQHWKKQKEFEGSDIWPVVRAFFPIFFFFDLTGRIGSVAARQHQLEKNPLTFHLILWTVLFFVDALHNTQSREVVTLGVLFTSVLLGLVRMSVLWQVQLVVNGICADEKGESNQRFNWINWIVMLVFGFFWVTIFSFLSSGGSINTPIEPGKPLGAERSSSAPTSTASSSNEENDARRPLKELPADRAVD